MNYRREIDGLRALAVLPVILFHAGFDAFRGGFVGVDVFFVISGYLITTIILSELEQGKFSIVDFYERRARRILPALLLVILVCMPAAWLWLLPSDMKDFSQSLIAVSIFSSNILFWHNSGYFDTAAELKPLLHTWSLAVEEQYYVLFPPFLMLFWRFGKRWVLVLLGFLFICSLAVAQWAAHAEPAAAFYLLPTRVWELLIGAFAAFYLSQAKRKDFDRYFCEVGGWLGVSLIFCAVFTYSKATPFPGLYALVPTLGTVLVILFATQQTTVGKFVGNKFFVGIGLISYSAYLWHQPLFAFARHRSLEQPSSFLFASLSGAALILAYLSWRFVEIPFRSKDRFSKHSIFAFSFFAICLPFTIGLLQLNFDFPTYLSFKNPELKEVPYSFKKWSGTPCSNFASIEGDTSCTFIRHGEPRSKVVIWGDSHALALTKIEPRVQNMELIVVGHSGCPPIANVVRFDHIGNSLNCASHNTLQRHLEWINAQNPEKILLVGRWSLYIEGFVREGKLQTAHHFLRDQGTDQAKIIHDKNLRKDILLSGLKRTLRALKAKEVYLVDQPMDFAEVGYRAMLRSPSISRKMLSNYNSSRHEVLSNIHHPKLIDLSKLFCNEVDCYTRLGGNMLYDDDNHLSAYGSSIVWEKLLHPILDAH